MSASRSLGSRGPPRRGGCGALIDDSFKACASVRASFPIPERASEREGEVEARAVECDATAGKKEVYEPVVTMLSADDLSAPGD